MMSRGIGEFDPVREVITEWLAVVVGLALLAAVKAILDRKLTDQATVTFTVAIGFGGFFAVTSDAATEAVPILAASLGAFAG